MTINAAQLLGIPKGTLEAGADADVTIIDPVARWTIDPTRFRSKSHNTPFGGWDVRGRAHTVIVGGEVRFHTGRNRPAGRRDRSGMSNGRNTELIPFCAKRRPAVDRKTE